MHSIIQNLEVKIYIVWKLKDTKLKITPTCCESSGSVELYLTEIIRSGSQMFVVYLLGV